MLKIIDNFVPKIYADMLEETCKEQIPWFLENNLSGEHDLPFSAPGADYSGPQHGFYHWALDQNGNKSMYFDKVLPLIYFIEEKTRVPVKEIYRIRLALSTSIKKEVQHRPHVDIFEPHKVLLYYVNDSDGDTFMFNEMFSENLKQNPLLDFTVKERVPPKKNRAVIFDGLRYHNSSKPVNNDTRYIINIDFN
jgi:hypothetical protein